MGRRIYPFPPGLLGAALLVWGWSIELPILSVILALLVELPRWIPWRVQFSEQDFIRISDLTSVILAGLSVYFLVQELQEGLFSAVSWMPLVGFPLLCTQLLGEKQVLPLSALIYRMRKNKTRHRPNWPEFVDIRPAYFMLTLVAASVVMKNSQWLYAIFSLLILWLLWGCRAHVNRAYIWVLMAGLGAVIGYGVHTGIFDLAVTLKNYAAQWYMNEWHRRNLMYSSTAIGRVGTLKLSDRIIMRISTEENAPIYLRQAAYNQLIDNFWHGRSHEAQGLFKSPASNIWRLTDELPPNEKSLDVAAEMGRGAATLVIPGGTHALAVPPDVILGTGFNGSINVEGFGSVLEYTAFYTQGQTSAGMPEIMDYWLSPEQNSLVGPLVNELDLGGMSMRQRVAAVRRFFHQKFRYSLIQEKPAGDPFTDFLYQKRSGHCEYFASTGALLLRAVGIPTRYVTGYLMTEYDEEHGQYLVRNRHAHAWNSVFLDGKWEDWDFTPSQWVALEQDSVSWWLPTYDYFSHIWFSLRRWYNSNQESFNYYVSGLGILLLLAYLIKEGGKEGWQANLRRRRDVVTKEKARFPGEHSALYEITKYLEQSVAPRYPGETLYQWMRRLELTGRINTESLKPLLDLHYCLRFSDGTPGVTEKLRAGVSDWLQFHGITVRDKNASVRR